MLYPKQLKENEYIRILAVRKARKEGDKDFTKAVFVQSFEEFQDYIETHKHVFELYTTLATTRGCINGEEGSLRQRKVLYLDFDKKENKDIKTAQDCMDIVKAKFPHLFIHAIINSGHGFHLYISIKPTCKLDEVKEINTRLIKAVGADQKAGLITQVVRIPTSYNMKHGEKTPVIVVNNFYEVGEKFSAYKLPYLHKMLNEYEHVSERMEQLEKREYHLPAMGEAYYCVRKAEAEGVDEGKRNFWLGRIINYKTMYGFTPEQIERDCLEFNKRCRPPKNPEEIKRDIKSYSKKNYHLLGCYESFPEDSKERTYVEEMCFKSNCKTYYKGTKVGINNGGGVRMNKKILTDKMLQTTSGYEYLVLTVLYRYKDYYARRGFTIKELKKRLTSPINKKLCMDEKTFKGVLDSLINKKYIEIKMDNQDDPVSKHKIKLVRKLNEFNQGYIEFYYSIANLLRFGIITQTDYKVYLCLVRNLDPQSTKYSTYEQLASDLNMDASNIGKCIRKLDDVGCLTIKHVYSQKGTKFNKYDLNNPNAFNGVVMEDEEEVHMIELFP
jgi:DNA-binding MarR family transcriptional regulator